MYEVKICTTGKFEIYNTGRKKIVFTGIDKKLERKEKCNRSLKFKNVEELMSKFTGLVSLATFKKMSKVLCAW